MPVGIDSAVLVGNAMPQCLRAEQVPSGSAPPSSRGRNRESHSSAWRSRTLPLHGVIVFPGGEALSREGCAGVPSAVAASPRPRPARNPRCTMPGPAPRPAPCPRPAPQPAGDPTRPRPTPPATHSSRDPLSDPPTGSPATSILSALAGCQNIHYIGCACHHFSISPSPPGAFRSRPAAARRAGPGPAAGTRLQAREGGARGRARRDACAHRGRR